MRTELGGVYHYRITHTTYTQTLRGEKSGVDGIVYGSKGPGSWKNPTTWERLI